MLRMPRLRGDFPNLGVPLWGVSLQGILVYWGYKRGTPNFGTCLYDFKASSPIAGVLGSLGTPHRLEQTKAPL